VEPDRTSSSTSTVDSVGIPRPNQVVAVLDDGRLVVIDVESGAVTRELYSLSDPRVTEGVAEPDPDLHAITDAVVGPDGETVYFGTIGGAGGVYRMPIDGSAAPERLTFGWGVSVSNDGRRLVFAYNRDWGVLDLEDGSSHSYPLPDGESSPVLRLSPDGTEVEVVSHDEDAVTQHQRVYTLNERGGVTATHDGSASWEGTATNLSDASGQWLLEIVALDASRTDISWGTSSEGLTNDIPNPDGLVIRTVDW
jgi:hypothetical protein